MKKLTGYRICCGIFIVVIMVLAYMLWDCRRKQGYCICAGAIKSVRNKVCQSKEQVRKAYDNGLTENSNFSKIQKEQGGPKWTTISPGDYNFPGEIGCTDEDKYLRKYIV